MNCWFFFEIFLKKPYYFSQDPPERPKGHDPSGLEWENSQLWSLSGESCPEETIPIRRTSEKDVLRASSIQRFGRKIQTLRRDSSSDGHEVSGLRLKSTHFVDFFFCLERSKISYTLFVPLHCSCIILDGNKFFYSFTRERVVDH